MNRRAAQTFLLGFLLVSSFVLLLLIIGDGWPQLRGPAPETSEWYWPHLVRPLARWWPSMVAAAVLWLLAAWWLWPERSTRRRDAFAMAGLVLAILALQTAVIYADRADVPAALIDRTLSNLASGFFEPAAEIADMNAVLRDYPAQMPMFVSEHARTHPPGLIVANWAAVQAFSQLEQISTTLAQWIWPLRCTDLWLLDRPPAVAAALGFWSVLPLLAAALTVVPAYLAARALLHGRGVRLAALLAATLPALLLFAPKSVQLYAPLGLLLFWLFHTGLVRSSLWRLFAAGLLLSFLSFLSLGNATLALLLALYGGMMWWLPEAPARLPLLRESAWKERVGQVLAFGSGAAAVWLLYWAGWGVAPWEIARVGLAQHYDLVTSLRRYEWWVRWNLLDLLVFSGWPLILGFGGSLLLAVRGWRRRAVKAVDCLAAALVMLILALDLSGSARGEVGRIWLFFMPLLAYPAARFWQTLLPGKGSAAVVVGLQLALLTALGLTWQPVRPVIVVAQPPAPLAAEPAISLEATFAGAPITLRAAEVTPGRVTAGDGVRVTLFWQAGGAATRPYTVFNHLLNADGELVAQADGWPAAGTWPPTCWRSGDLIIDRHTLLVPPGTPAGQYQVRSGLYDARDGTRLLLPDGRDAVDIAPVEVAAPPGIDEE